MPLLFCRLELKVLNGEKACFAQGANRGQASRPIAQCYLTKVLERYYTEIKGDKTLTEQVELAATPDSPGTTL